MTKIKLCGLTRSCDIAYANALRPDYIGFVFAPGSRRFLSAQAAAQLQKELHPDIIPVGVFVDEAPEVIAELLEQGIIKAVQLHGNEDDAYIRQLRSFTDRPIIKAFRLRTEADAKAANCSTADLVLLDSGGGTGKPFDWQLLQYLRRDYILAGGLTPENIAAALSAFHPFAVDASSSLETDGVKSFSKMSAFVNAVRNRKEHDHDKF